MNLHPVQMYSCFNYRITGISQVDCSFLHRFICVLFFSINLDSIDPSDENIKKLELSDIEKLESKLDEIIDRLLSIRSELIARQFENDLQTNIPCRLQ